MSTTLPPQAETGTASSTLRSADSHSQNVPLTRPSVDRLKEKLRTLNAQRTGATRRLQMQQMKKQAAAAGPSQNASSKSAMRTMAKDSIRAVLQKFGIQDKNIEQSIMNEIASGQLRTPTQIAEAITRKLQVTYPRPSATVPAIPSVPAVPSVPAIPSVSSTPQNTTLRSAGSVGSTTSDQPLRPALRPPTSSNLVRTNAL